MKKFVYKARDKSGLVVTGQVEAVDENAAAKLVRERGLILVSLRSTSFSIDAIVSGLRSRISGKDVTAFTRQLATMVGAGLPLTNALTILKTQSKPAMQERVGRILADVEGGQSLSSALQKHSKLFSSTYVALIRAGETGGVLDKVLQRLADNMEKSEEFKGKVKGALIYPAVIVVGMLVVSTIMLIFVVPRLTALYDQFDVELPITTRILTATSDFMIKAWPIMLVAFGGMFWAFVLYRRTAAGRHRLSRISLAIPIFGVMRLEIILTELTRTLSLMIGAGVPILDGIAVTAGVVDNVVVSEALNDVGKQIEKGFPISYSFAKHPEAFPFILSQMIAVGEETGKMDEVLDKVSHVFEVSSEQKVKAMSSLIEPLVMVVLGLGVAFLVISIILPIYNLTSTI